MNGITALIVVSTLVSSVICGSCTVTLEGETNYNQDEMVELTCRWVKIDYSANKLEIREEHGLILYETTVYNESFFRVCDAVKTIDEDNYYKDYTYTVRARSGRLFDGKTFTCQCGGATSSKTLSVSNTTYGDCSGTLTSVSVVFENGTTVHKKATAPTYITPCGVVENQIIIDCVNAPFKNWVISFTKPSACTRRLTLWGRNDQTDVECQLDVTADVSGDVHTFNISNTNFPKCTDGSATKEWKYVVKLEAKSGTWLDQATMFGLTDRGISSSSKSPHLWYGVKAKHCTITGLIV